MKTFASLMNEVKRELQDISNKIWTAAELTIQLEDAIREVSEYEPYIVKETFTIESRTGSDTAGAANKLTDDSNDQFVAGDVDKVIFNKTDKTWAVITAYDDAETLSISKDIMDDDEDYAIFNKGCYNNKQINIEDVTDWIGDDYGVIAVEYPIGKRRNFDVDGDILTLDIDFEPDDSADTDADKEVYVWFEKRHRVSQLTDLAGEIDLVAGYSAGDTSIHVDGLQTTGTFGEDTLFTIEHCRGTYRVTADATIASSECDLTIYTAGGLTG